jgi:hypothetical protein
MAERFESFTDFWPFYVCEHSAPLTRAQHFIGTATIIPLAAAAWLSSPWFILMIPVSAYGFAWIAHFYIECNRPTTLTHPFWSLIGDLKMFGHNYTGHMSEEIERSRRIRESRIC